MFGTQYFAQTYFGGSLVQNSANYGGMFGTPAFGQTYFAGENQPSTPVPPIPPIPPIPPAPTAGYGVGARRNPIQQAQPKPRYRRDPALKAEVFVADERLEHDEEDILTIVSLWLTIK